MKDIANKIIKDNLDKTEEIYQLELQIETLNKAYDKQTADWKQCHENNDKLRIENAKLAEQLKNAVVLPCKVGDTVYFNTYKNNASECIGIQPHKVENICVGYYVGNYTTIYGYDFGNSVFLTKHEAEARLAELEAKNDRD